MTVISGDELSTLSGLGFSESFSSETGINNSINNTINTFLGDGELNGPGWDAIKATYGRLGEALQKRSAAETDLSKAITDAVALLIEYLGEFTSLDDSKLDFLEHQIEVCYRQINMFMGQINRKKKVIAGYDNWDTEHKYPIYKEVYMYSEETRANMQKAIDGFNEKIESINKEIAKIEGLPAIIEQAMDILNGAETSLTAFTSAIGKI